jgi:hypothetical protein
VRFPLAVQFFFHSSRKDSITHKAALLYGRGPHAGVDRREQKKQAAEFEQKMMKKIRESQVCHGPFPHLFPFFGSPHGNIWKKMNCSLVKSPAYAYPRHYNNTHEAALLPGGACTWAWTEPGNRSRPSVSRK